MSTLVGLLGVTHIVAAAEPPPPCDVAGDKTWTKRPTGFFRASTFRGRWWVFTPRGEAFFIVGTDHISYKGHWCEKLRYAPYNRVVERQYGSETAWAKDTVQRLNAWGFNSLTAGHSASLRYQGLPHTEFLSLGAGYAAVQPLVPRGNWTGFPNVFDPGFQSYCEKIAAQRCAPHRDDPWLLGYFIDNELEWYGKAPHGSLRNWALTRPANDPARQAAEKCDTEQFIRMAAERYFAITTAAIRKHDPNHMILGCRFAGNAPADIWEIAGKHCDIVSLNIYPRVNLERAEAEGVENFLNEVYRKTRRPLMITEWSFPALDAVDSEGRPLPCQHGAGMRVDTQEQKARCCEIMQGLLFKLPFLVGSDYFMWMDEPAFGISSSFPEDSNYGLVGETNRPYETLVSMFAKLNPQVYRIHATGEWHGHPARESLRKQSPTHGLEAHATGAIRVERAGDHLTVDNSVLRLVKDNPGANAWDRVELDGVVLGRFIPNIHIHIPQSAWVQPDRVTTITVSNEPARGIVDMTFERERTYRTAYRFTIYPEQNWFLAQFLWLENIDTKPWRFVEYFHYLPSFIGGSVDGDTVGGGGVPNYYLPFAAWVDKVVGKQYGAIGQREEDFQVTFWVSDGGYQHPDAVRKTDVMLSPGERYAVPQPSIIIFGASAAERPPALVRRVREAATE